MGNRNKEEIVYEDEPITKEQLGMFEAKAGEYGSEEAMLIGLSAIRICEIYGTRIMRFFDGLVGTKDPITGQTFRTGFPLDLYQRFIDELKRKESQKEFAKKKQLEAVAESVNSDLQDVDL